MDHNTMLHTAEVEKAKSVKPINPAKPVEHVAEGKQVNPIKPAKPLEHVADQHVADQHVAEQHVADQHVAEQHVADQHVAELLYTIREQAEFGLDCLQKLDRHPNHRKSLVAYAIHALKEIKECVPPQNSDFAN